MAKSSSFYLTTVVIVLMIIISTVIVVPVTDEEQLLDSSFSVEPRTQYGPYDDGTVCHPKILGFSTLRGVVDVDGGGIFLTVNGHYTEELKNVFISQTLSFMIENAHEQYTFAFNNTANSTEVQVHLSIAETWTRPVAFLSPLTTYIVFGCGVILVIGISLIIVKRVRLRSIK